MMRGGDSELFADLWRFYGINLDDALDTLGARRVADLAAGLPPGCRSMAKVDPTLAWDTQTWMLSRIEFDLRGMVWDGKGKEPKQVMPPECERAREDNSMTEEELARILSMPRVAAT